MIAGIVHRCATAPIALIGAVHVAGGITVLMAPQAVKVSALSGPVLLGLPPFLLAFILIVVGGLAVVSQMPAMESENYVIALSSPQQVLLAMQFFGIALSLTNGAYPDGYVPVPESYWASFWFILGDQLALLAFCLSHTLEMIAAKVLKIPTRGEYEKHLAEKLALGSELESAKRQLALYNDTKFWIGLTNETG
jgi:hypothetical protein